MGLGTIKRLMDELRMRYGRATDKLRSVLTLPKNQTVLILRDILGILSDPWHVTTYHSMPLQISQGH